jgi:hypothetical protein
MIDRMAAALERTEREAQRAVAPINTAPRPELPSR